MQDEYLTERLPVVRISPSLKERLERVVTTNRLGQMSDHIRYALEQYVTMAEESDAFKERLERVTTASINRRLSDHIRYALEQYVTMAEESDPRLQQPSSQS